MSVADLEREIGVAGFGWPLTHCDGHAIRHSDQLELLCSADGFRVSEIERGVVLEEYYSGPDPATALATFLEKLTGRATFLAASREAASIEHLAARLAQQGIRSWPNEVTNLQDVKPIYRLFVPVIDWRRAQSVLLAMKDQGYAQ